MATASPDKTASKSSAHDISEDLAAELTAIKTDISALATTLSAIGKDRLGALPDMVSQTAEETLESARRALKEIRREVASVEHDVERRVVEHPLQSLLIAVGLGFLVAFLIRR